jgi:glycosyltransferase involved in cell wall biosynthesis
VPASPSDVVFTFFYLHWDGAQQRGMHFSGDRLAQTLVEDHRVRQVMITNWFRSVPFHLARAAFPRAGARFPTTSRASLHEPVRLRRHDPLSMHGIERAYRRFDRSLERAARRKGLERPAVITMHPLVAAFAPLEWAGPVTYVASDDWSAASHEHEAYVPAYEQAYLRIADSGCRLCAVSQQIVDRVRPTGPAIVVPNGIDPAQWTDIGPPPAWFDRLPTPRLLYVGTLDRRIDVDLVSQAATAVPEGSVVLVGPFTDPGHLAPVAAMANVHVRHPVAHAEVPGLISAAEACMIPHVRMQLTQAMSPLKLYEYLAAGRPVVAVDLPPIRDVDPRVVLVAETDDFGQRAREALALGPAPEGLRRRFVEQNSWRRRHEAILDFALADPPLALRTSELEEHARRTRSVDA